MKTKTQSFVVVNLLMFKFGVAIANPVKELKPFTLTFQIEDTARQKLTRLKKGTNFWARVTEVRPKHRGH